MESELQEIEIEPVRRDDDDLAIHDAIWREPADQRIVQFRKVAVERPRVATLDVHFGCATIHDRPESIPLGLEEKLSAGREGLRQSGEHRLDGRGDREGGRHGG